MFRASACRTSLFAIKMDCWLFHCIADLQNNDAGAFWPALPSRDIFALTECSFCSGQGGSAGPGQSVASQPAPLVPRPMFDPEPRQRDSFEAPAASAPTPAFAQPDRAPTPAFEPPHRAPAPVFEQPDGAPTPAFEQPHRAPPPSFEPAVRASTPPPTAFETEPPQAPHPFNNRRSTPDSRSVQPDAHVVRPLVQPPMPRPQQEAAQFPTPSTQPPAPQFHPLPPQVQREAPPSFPHPAPEPGLQMQPPPRTFLPDQTAVSRSQQEAGPRPDEAQAPLVNGRPHSRDNSEAFDSDKELYARELVAVAALEVDFPLSLVQSISTGDYALPEY